MTGHYTVIEDRRSGRKHCHRIIHIATGAIITPLDFNICEEEEAEQWKARAESAAPTHNPEEAERMLRMNGYKKDWDARDIHPMPW